MTAPCNPLTPDAQKALVEVPEVNPFAFQWILANNRRDDDVGSNVTFVKAPRSLHQGLNGAVIHMGTERLAQNPPLGKWHHVSMDVAGELMTDAGATPPATSDVQSIGNRSSLLKARITLDMGTGRQRDFDFDIGAGVEFDVACYAVSKIEVLIPDPRVAIPTDPPFQPTLPTQQLSTVLTSTIYFLLYGTHQRAPVTYTVPAIITGAPGDMFIPRQPDAVALSFCVDSVAVLAGDFTVDFIYVAGGLPQATYVAPGAFTVVSQVSTPAGFSCVPQTLIPGNANAFRVRRFDGALSPRLSIIQVLNP